MAASTISAAWWRMIRSAAISRAPERAVTEAIAEIPMAWSGGCDGILAPHATVFARTATAGTSQEKRLALGTAISEEILPEDIGRPAMVEKVAAAVRVAMQRVRHRIGRRRAFRSDQDAGVDGGFRARSGTARPDRGMPDPAIGGRRQRHQRARRRGGAGRDRDAARRPDLPGHVALFVGRQLLLRRRGHAARRWCCSATRKAPADATGSAIP